RSAYRLSFRPPCPPPPAHTLFPYTTLFRSNWSLVYLISRFNEKIWQRIDYPFLILSIALAVSVAIRLFSSGIPTKRILLTAVAGIFAVYNVYRYWSYFKERKRQKKQNFHWKEE